MGVHDGRAGVDARDRIGRELGRRNRHPRIVAPARDAVERRFDDHGGRHGRQPRRSPKGADRRRGYRAAMPIVAAVWRPVEGPPHASLVLRPALADQGPYARGRPFAAFAIGTDDTPRAAIAALGELVWAWRAEETVPRAGPTDCAVSMVSLMRRNPAITREAFVRHWLDRHAPLALRRHVGLADYHQYVVTETLTADTPTIDGVAWLGFVTRSDFEARFFDSDEGRAEIMADVARFMDRPGPETTLVGPPGAAGTSG